VVVVAEVVLIVVRLYSPGRLLWTVSYGGVRIPVLIVVGERRMSVREAGGK